MPQCKVVGQSSGFSNNAGTPAPALVMRCELPPGIQVGEKLRLYVTLNSGSMPPDPTGWPSLGMAPTGNAMRQVYERVADGSEGDHVDVQLHATTPKPGAYICERIADYEDAPLFPTRSQSQGTAPNPPAVSPPGSVDYMITAMAAVRWGHPATGPVVSAYPTDYDEFQAYAVCQCADGVGIAVAHKNVVGAADPGSFTMSGIVSWCADTVAQKSTP